MECFDRNVGLFCSCFSVAMGGRGYHRWFSPILLKFYMIKLDCKGIDCSFADVDSYQS